MAIDIEGILIISVVLISLTAFLKKGAPIIRDSILAPHVTMVSENMVKIVPKDMKKAFTDKLEELRTAWNQR